MDIGGTFTDLQILDARSGSVQAWKTPTTPEDPSLGLLTSMREASVRFISGAAGLCASPRHLAAQYLGQGDPDAVVDDRPNRA